LSAAYGIGGKDDDNDKNESDCGGGDSGGNMLELSQMGISKQAHCLKFPLNRVPGMSGYAYILTTNSQ
jgi:hypothetical protein